MELDVFFAMVGFGIVTTITPGPNNLLLLASGLNFGVRRSFPHILGIAHGFTLLVVCVGFGLGQLLEIYPLAFTAIKVAGGVYMLYLAWRIANSGPMEVGRGKARPMTYLEACAFQWVNPKAWVVAVIIVSTYTNESNFYVVMAIIVAYTAVVNLPLISTWAVFGQGLKRFLTDARKIRIFNISMAVLLVASLWPMLK